ncbi:MAG: hypothetical protein ACR2NZ_18020 [Rubripirellula sp.]
MPFRHPAKQGLEPAQQAGTQADTSYLQQSQGSSTHQRTLTGGGGGQQTGAGAQQLAVRPKQPASAGVEAANASTAAAMHPAISPRKGVIGFSRVGRWNTSDGSYFR